jgi:hypothetical protein
LNFKSNRTWDITIIESKENEKSKINGIGLFPIVFTSLGVPVIGFCEIDDRVFDYWDSLIYKFELTTSKTP